MTTSFADAGCCCDDLKCKCTCGCTEGACCGKCSGCSGCSGTCCS